MNFWNRTTCVLCLKPSKLNISGFETVGHTHTKNKDDIFKTWPLTSHNYQSFNDYMMKGLKEKLEMPLTQQLCEHTDSTNFTFYTKFMKKDVNMSIYIKTHNSNQ